MAQTRVMTGTQAVGGNAALALLLTVVTNLAGIFTMPFVLCWLLGAGRASLTLSPGPLLANLMRAILAPLLLGATVRGIVPGAPPALLPFLFPAPPEPQIDAAPSVGAPPKAVPNRPSCRVIITRLESDDCALRHQHVADSCVLLSRVVDTYLERIAQGAISCIIHVQ